MGYRKYVGNEMRCSLARNDKVHNIAIGVCSELSNFKGVWCLAIKGWKPTILLWKSH